MAWLLKSVEGLLLISLYTAKTVFCNLGEEGTSWRQKAEAEQREGRHDMIRCVVELGAAQRGYCIRVWP